MRIIIILFIFILSFVRVSGLCPHYLYVGPDVCYRAYSEKDLPSDGKSDEYGFLGGLVAGYDYIASRDVYVGADIRGDAGRTVYDGSLVYLPSGEITPYKSHTDNFIFNAEIRLGYTYEPFYCITMIPFIGYGYHYWFRGSVPDNPYGYDEAYNWSYFAMGIRGFYPLCKDLLIGANFKLMLMIDARMESSNLNDTPFTLGNRIQWEIELPLTYRLPYAFLNLIQFVPYVRNQDIGKSNCQNVFLTFPDGSESLVSVHEPRSVTYVVGAKLQLIHNF